jgi:hypothetical protein
MVYRRERSPVDINGSLICIALYWRNRDLYAYSYRKVTALNTRLVLKQSCYFHVLSSFRHGNRFATRCLKAAPRLLALTPDWC